MSPAPDALVASHVGRLRAFCPLIDVEADGFALLQIAVAAPADRGVVHKDVRPAPTLGDEAKALLGVEPFHNSCSHARSVTGRDRRAVRGA